MDWMQGTSGAQILMSLLAGVIGAGFVVYGSRLYGSSAVLTARRCFHIALIEGIRSGTVVDLKDAQSLLSGCVTWHRARGVSDRALPIELRLVLVELLNRKTPTSTGTKPEEDITARVLAMVRLSEIEEPYAGVPDAERNVLRDLRAHLDFEEESETVPALKLAELASLIQARAGEVDSLRAVNRWSVRIAIVGAVLTIVFGAAPFFR